MCVYRLCPSSTLPIGNLIQSLLSLRIGSGRRPGYNTEHFGQSMSAEIKSHLTELLTRALAKVAPQQPGSLISLERPKQAQHGDFSCPAAMQLARALKRNPRELALELVAALPPSEGLERAEGAGSGFINLRVRPPAKQHIVETILPEAHPAAPADRAGRRAGTCASDTLRP